MKWILTAAVLVVAGCEGGYGTTADEELAAATKESMSEANRQVGMPAITNFQERRLAKMLLELRDQENLPTYAYIVNLQGELVYLGRCIGYGLPASVQYSNPERVLQHDEYPGAGPGGTIPQPEPNGLFMPEGLAGTWLMMVDGKGDAHPVYVEPEVIVSPFPLHTRPKP